VLQKFILIGIGGSGGKTLRYTWRELQRRLEACGAWEGRMPAGWQFLHLDPRSTPDGYDDDAIPRVEELATSYLGFCDFPVKFGTYAAEVTANPAALSAVVDWLPERRTVKLDPWQGAGQMRAVGRLYALASLDEIGDRIDALVTAINNAAADTEMERISRALGSAANPNAPQPKVIMVGSLAGGSGAGMFLDVAEMLRGRSSGLDSWLGQALAFLYTPDVFDDLPAGLRKGTNPNALASISELLAAWFWDRRMSAAEESLLTMSGANTVLEAKRSPAYCMLIGRSNGVVAFDGRDVYSVLGKSLGSFLTNEGVQEQFNSYLGALQAAPDRLRICGEEGGAGACSSLGYASVSLGRGLFATYASERLARAAVDRLLRSPTGVESIAGSLAPAFFERCGLREADDVTGNTPVAHNQIVDSLRDKEAVRGALRQIIDEVKADLGARSGTLELASWASGIDGQIAVRRERFLIEQRDERNRKARTWCDSTITALVAATTEVAFAEGILVANQLLVELDEQLESAETQLRLDAGKDRTRLFSLLDKVVNLGAKVKAAFGNKNVDALLAQAKDNLGFESRAEVYDFTSRLIADFRKSVIPSLREALEKARNNLQSTISPAGLSSKEYESWSLGPVPKRLEPTKNEIVLDPIGDFPEQFRHLLTAVFEFEVERIQQAEEMAVVEAMTGSWGPGGESRGRLVEVTNWVPDLEGVRSGAAKMPSFQFSLSLSSMLERSRDWVAARPGRMSDYVRENLREYLSSGAPNPEQRAQAFAGAIAAALRASAPLTGIDANLISRVHGGKAEIVYTISDIPIAQDHLAFDSIKNSLVGTLKCDPEEAVDCFDATSSAQAVEITSMFEQLLHPVVFSSLMSPIASRWGQASSSSSERREFWLNRRARPMESFIPMSPRYQELMVRGWMIAHALGYISEPSGRRPAGERIQVWSEEGMLGFPEFLLGKELVNGFEDRFPALLESFPIALVALSTGSDNELMAYRRLIELGMPESGDARDLRVGAELRDWIINGPAGEAPGVVPPECAGAANPPERKEALRRLFAEAHTVVSDLRDARLEPGFEVTRRWGIGALLITACAELAEAVTLVDVGDVRTF